MFRPWHGSTFLIATTLLAGCPPTPEPVCGNSVIEGDELCDGADLGGATCSSVSPSFTGGTLSCGSGCTAFDVTLCELPQPECGNGIVAAPEEVCDGADLNGVTCGDLGDHPGGPLVCNADCMGFNTSGCYAPPTVPIPRLPMQDAWVGTIHAPGSMRPTFAWEASTVDGGIPIAYELELSLADDFATVADTLVSATTTAIPAADLVVPLTPPVGNRFYWRVRAVANDVTSDWSVTRRVNVGRSPKDGDGDGYDDAIVGAPYDSDAGGQAGAAFLFKGGAGGLPTGYVQAFNGTFGLDHLGEDVAWAGDVNGDGFADLLLGIPGHGTSDERGAFRLYLGTMFGFVDSPQTREGTDPVGRLGTSVAGAGDLNGDGFGDVAVGVPGADEVWVYFGHPLGIGLVADLVLTEGPGPGAGEYGGSVDGAGDVNGDGIADLIVGAPFDGLGTAYVYFGGAAFDDIADFTFTETGAGEIATRVAGLGDLNGDGFADVGVSHHLDGRVYVLLGSPAGPTASAATLLDPSATPGSWFGLGLRASGDVDCDGYDDVLIGGPLGGIAGEGVAGWFRGGPGAMLDPTADRILLGLLPADRFGESVSGGGDYDADGCDDLLVGAPRPADVGYARVFSGEPGFGAAVTAPLQLTGTVLHRFGYAVH